MENLISFLWGFAEATVFFFVPDVGISIFALEDSNAGLQTSLYALAGALLGGAIMYYWGRADLPAVVRILNRIPAIRPVDIERVRSALQKSGVFAVLLGPTIGIPYKIYASHAHLNISFWKFMLISIPARMIRFALVGIATPYAMDKLLPGASKDARLQVLVLFWALMYAGYIFLKSRR